MNLTGGSNAGYEETATSSWSMADIGLVEITASKRYLQKRTE
jgi:hypothetical protein